MEGLIKIVLIVLVAVLLISFAVYVISTFFPVFAVIGVVAVIAYFLPFSNNDKKSEKIVRKQEPSLSNYKNIRLKEGVNLATLQPAMVSAVDVICGAYQQVLGDDYEPTITSGDDYDKHRRNSAHYHGAALDFRLKDIPVPEMREEVTEAVRQALGKHFFVDHENPGKWNEHLHVQLRNFRGARQ